jgi:flagellar basal body rod protein FlgC
MDAIDRIFGGMHIASTGLAAERARIDVIAQNIANAQTTLMP